jgi:hypothetical protein
MPMRKHGVATSASRPVGGSSSTVVGGCSRSMKHLSMVGTARRTLRADVAAVHPPDRGEGDPIAVIHRSKPTGSSDTSLVPDAPPPTRNGAIAWKT